MWTEGKTIRDNYIKILWGWIFYDSRFFKNVTTQTFYLQVLLVLLSNKSYCSKDGFIHGIFPVYWKEGKNRDMNFPPNRDSPWK